MKKILKKAIQNYSFHDIGLFSSAFAYSAILSLPALILFILFIVKVIFRGAYDIEALINRFGSSLPGESGGVLLQFVNNSIELTGFWTGLATVALLFWGGTKLIYFFTIAVNNSFGLKIDKNKTNFFATIYSRLLGLIFIVLFVISMFSSVFIGTALNSLFDNQLLFFLINFGTSFAVYTILYAFVLRFMVLVKVNFVQSLLGGMLVSLLTVVGISLITLVLNSIDLTSDFAIGASLILFLIWINYISTIIFFGFELVNVYLRENKLFVARDIADEKYVRDININNSVGSKISGAAKVLELEAKAGWWFFKRSRKKKKQKNKS